MELFGIRFVGFNEENAQKLMLTVVFLSAAFVIKWLCQKFVSVILPFNKNLKVRFWTRQGLNIFFSLIMVLVFLSIWFDDPTRLATGLGLMSAGLAFALQKVVTSFAGYLVVMRGNTFSVGDRITMGGIRGDVISLGFLQTTIMEMGQPDAVQGADPAMWVKGRQFTGRIVTVTNDKIFENPVFNYTRDFPFIWEEFTLPVKYDSDYKKVESIILRAVAQYTESNREMSQTKLQEVRQRFGLQAEDTTPKVFFRLTDNWIELTARFIVPEHGVRHIKDKIARDVLKSLEEARIGVASSTFEIVGFHA